MTERYPQVVKWGAAILLMLTILGLSPEPALAHDSDFETLTIDLIVSSEGLETIDAAVVESSGPSYEPAPSVEMREEVAHRVLSTLGVEASTVDLDVENSERYHWVGFTIHIHDPSLGGQSQLQVDTRPLQDIAAEIGLARLKMSVCPPDVASAGQFGRASQIGSTDRPGCQLWELNPMDEAISITVTLRQLPATGLESAGIVRLLTVLFACGLGFLAVARWKSSRPSLYDHSRLDNSNPERTRT